mmetsp:Transcript_3090/g.11657  ORF Transcript_3090/g.11657 Transcript_3090/m.11657 type:complete len:344 (+) Transcript_3090:478-1509(+)
MQSSALSRQTLSCSRTVSNSPTLLRTSSSNASAVDASIASALVKRASSARAAASTPAAARSASLSALAISDSAAAMTSGDAPAEEASAAAAAWTAAVATASSAVVFRGDFAKQSLPAKETRSMRSPVTRAISARCAIAEAVDDTPSRLRCAVSSNNRSRLAARSRALDSSNAAEAATGRPCPKPFAFFRSAANANAPASAAREIDPALFPSADGTPAAFASLLAIWASCVRCISSSHAAASAAAPAASRSTAFRRCISRSAVWYPRLSRSVLETSFSFPSGAVSQVSTPPPYASKSGQSADVKSSPLVPGFGGRNTVRGCTSPWYQGNFPASTVALARASAAS